MTVSSIEQGGTGMSRSDAVWLVVLFTNIIATAYGFGVYLFGTIAPDMAEWFRLSPERIGLAAAASQVGHMAGAALAGTGAQKLGLFRCIVIAQLVSAAALGLLSGSSEFWHLIVLLFLLGAMAAATWVPMVPVVQQCFRSDRRATVLGILASGTAIGVMINGFAAQPIISAWGWSGPWAVSAALSLLIGMCTVWRLGFLINVSEISGSAAGARDLNLLDRSRVMPVAIMFLNGLGFLPYQTYLTSFLRSQLGWGGSEATLVWSFMGVGGLLGGFLFGLLADRLSVKRAMFVAYLLLAFSTLAVILQLPLPLLYAAGLVFGLGYNAVFGLMGAYLAKTLVPSLSRSITGACFVSLGAGSFLGNALAGWLAGTFGSYVIVYSCVVAIAGLLVILSHMLRDDRPSVSTAKGIAADTA